jgi:hypothetical protein
LHAVGKTDDHDERGHHVQEHVQTKAEPAQSAEREDDGEQRRPGRDDHEGHTPEEQDRDHAAGDEADCIIDEPVALDGIADLELHHRHAGQFRREASAFQILRHALTDIADHAVEFRALHDVRVERQNDEGQSAVVREQLAADEVIAHHVIDQLLILGTLRQLLRKERSGNATVHRRLARGKQRNDAARAVDELQVGDETAQLVDRIAGEQRLAFDHHQNVVFVRRKPPRHFFELLEFRCIRSEQLAERIVDLDLEDAKDGRNCQQKPDRDRNEGRADRDEAEPLDAECDVVPLLHPSVARRSQ